MIASFQGHLAIYVPMCLFIPLKLLVNAYLKTLPRQRIYEK
jgi:hypothetical protein